MEVHGVGKIERPVRRGGGERVARGRDERAGARTPSRSSSSALPSGLVFANLIETDQVYGHRKDVRGFAGALREIDACVGACSRACASDLLIVTADHGVDPAHPGTDHTREYAPLLAVTGAMLARRAAGGSLGGARHDGPLADVGATVLRWLTGGDGDGGRCRERPS